MANTYDRFIRVVETLNHINSSLGEVEMISKLLKFMESYQGVIGSPITDDSNSWEKSIHLNNQFYIRYSLEKCDISLFKRLIARRVKKDKLILLKPYFRSLKEDVRFLKKELPLAPIEKSLTKEEARKLKNHCDETIKAILKS